LLSTTLATRQADYVSDSLSIVKQRALMLQLSNDFESPLLPLSVTKVNAFLKIN
jgi:hypothetical protein